MQTFEDCRNKKLTNSSTSSSEKKEKMRKGITEIDDFIKRQALNETTYGNLV